MKTLLRKDVETNDIDIKKKRRRVVLGILLFILLLIMLFIFDFFRKANSALVEMYEPLGDTVVDLREEELSEQSQDENPEEHDSPKKMNLGEDPFSLLILGLDGPRSDAMMLATVNPNTGSTYLLSIARDTMVTISGHGSTTRINHAFAYGGIDMAINTVQDFLNVPIDYYVTLDMYEFPSLVDAFGGVSVYNDTVAFSMGGYHFPLGDIDLTGSSAYYYARMRMDDPRGDFGRQERQRDIIGAMVNELAGVTVVTRYHQIFDAVGAHMRMNITLSDIITIFTGYNRALRNITNLDLHAPGRIIGGMYLIPIPETQRLEVSTKLRTHLELE